jgi:hypothetical protein
METQHERRTTISDLGSPHGQSVGLLTCTAKNKNNGNVTVFFRNDHNNSAAIFKLSAEDSEYFVVGKTYDFRATTP